MQPGEPEFLPEDTDGGVALAEEERDTCPQCGMLKVWCRDAAKHQFSFEPSTSVCWPTEALAVYRNTDGFKKHKDSVRAAMQVSARFREGVGPDFMAGLDLPLEERGGADEDAEDR